MRTVGSHLGRIPNCSEVPDTRPPPPQGTTLPGAPPPPPRRPTQNSPLSDPPPKVASSQHLVGGVVGVQNCGVAPLMVLRKRDFRVLLFFCVPCGIFRGQRAREHNAASRQNEENYIRSIQELQRVRSAGRPAIEIATPRVGEKNPLIRAQRFGLKYVGMNQGRCCISVSKLGPRPPTHVPFGCCVVRVMWNHNISVHFGKKFFIGQLACGLCTIDSRESNCSSGICTGLVFRKSRVQAQLPTDRKFFHFCYRFQPAGTVKRTHKMQGNIASLPPCDLHALHTTCHEGKGTQMHTQIPRKHGNMGDDCNYSAQLGMRMLTSPLTIARYRTHNVHNRDPVGFSACCS